jgi:hypothetical protein
MGYFLMKLRKYYQAVSGYSRGKVVKLKEKTYTMLLAEQRQDVIYQYFLLRNLVIKL